MSSDGTTARRADDQRRSIDDLCAISETGTQSAARYRGAVQRQVIPFHSGSEVWNCFVFKDRGHDSEQVGEGV